ncbi:MAG: 50S ribosomal protein L15 [Saprospiraceae bacterium]
MELHNLRPAKGATKNRKRIARGQGSGHGGTATRGHKGAKSRSGYKSKMGFEGGQMPLQRRIPKRGFKNINRVDYVGINLDRLQGIAEKYNIDTITPEVLFEKNVIKRRDLVKILGGNSSDLTSKLSVTAHAYSASAKEAIEKAGGSASIVVAPVKNTEEKS